MCGELASSAIRASRSAGSSPRVRGTRLGAGDLAVEERFIPACAGNSARWSRSAPRAAVHPRVCGELSVMLPHAEGADGSSPRVRGTPCAVAVLQRERPVHPRVCGELSVMLPHAEGADGSSPRVRGTPQQPQPRHPAMQVHPRVCGELSVMLPHAEGADGSSPRVRGTPQQPQPRHPAMQVHPRVCGELPARRQTCGALPRFIPACAGNSLRTRRKARTTTVHPRVCGELGVGEVNRDLADGSSPRVWGTRRRKCRGGRAWGFIPACAGNSRPTSHPARC